LMKFRRQLRLLRRSAVPLQQHKSRVNECALCQRWWLGCFVLKPVIEASAGKRLLRDQGGALQQPLQPAIAKAPRWSVHAEIAESVIANAQETRQVPIDVRRCVTQVVEQYD